MSVYDFDRLTQLKICCYNQKWLLQPCKNAIFYYLNCCSDQFFFSVSKLLQQPIFSFSSMWYYNKYYAIKFSTVFYYYFQCIILSKFIAPMKMFFDYILIHQNLIYLVCNSNTEKTVWLVYTEIWWLTRLNSKIWSNYLYGYLNYSTMVEWLILQQWWRFTCTYMFLIISVVNRFCFLKLQLNL